MSQEVKLAPPTDEKFKNTLAFFVFAFVSYTYLTGVVDAAAEDVLAETAAPTAVVYICDVGPYFVGCLILPMFLHRVTPLSTVVMAVFLNIAGIVLVAVLEIPEVKLIGISFVSLACSFSDVGLLSMTAFYEEITSRVYSAGSGFGTAFGIVYYTGMTTWFSVSMKTTLLLLVWLPLLFLVFFWLMDKKLSQDSKTTTHQDIPYRRLDSHLLEVPLTCKDKLKVLWENMPLALPMYTGILGRTLLPQAVVTTLVFPNAPFSPRDHYQYYMLAFVAGDVLGKSYGLLVRCVKCNLPQYTKHTWVFASLIVTCAIFLVFEAWFRFLHNVWIVVSICFVVGINSGIIYDFTFAAASGQQSSYTKEFSRAFLAFPFSVGLLCASLLGLYTEPLLEERCMYVIRNTTQCITRIMP